MLVAAEFRRAGFSVIQSDYYQDPVEGVQREIDVAAHTQVFADRNLLRVTFLVECKVSRDKPWVLFTAESVRLAGPARVVQRTSSRLGNRLLRRLSRKEEIQDLPFFTLPTRPGYGLTQALRKPEARDLSYQATTGVPAAAAAQARDADVAAKEQELRIAEIIFPIVLVDGRLFEAYLDEKCQVSVGEIESGILVWRNPVAAVGHSIIRISTLASLASLVQDAKRTAERLLEERDGAFVAVLTADAAQLSARADFGPPRS